MDVSLMKDNCLVIIDTTLVLMSGALAMALSVLPPHRQDKPLSAACICWVPTRPRLWTSCYICWWTDGHPSQCRSTATPRKYTGHMGILHGAGGGLACIPQKAGCQGGRPRLPGCVRGPENVLRSSLTCPYITDGTI